MGQHASKKHKEPPIKLDNGVGSSNLTPERNKEKKQRKKRFSFFGRSKTRTSVQAPAVKRRQNSGRRQKQALQETTSSVFEETESPIVSYIQDDGVSLSSHSDSGDGDRTAEFLRASKARGSSRRARVRASKGKGKNKRALKAATENAKKTSLIANGGNDLNGLQNVDSHMTGKVSPGYSEMKDRDADATTQGGETAGISFEPVGSIEDVNAEKSTIVNYNVSSASSDVGQVSSVAHKLTTEMSHTENETIAGVPRNDCFSVDDGGRAQSHSDEGVDPVNEDISLEENISNNSNNKADSVRNVSVDLPVVVQEHLNENLTTYSARDHKQEITDDKEIAEDTSEIPCIKSNEIDADISNRVSVMVNGPIETENDDIEKAIDKPESTACAENVVPPETSAPVDIPLKSLKYDSAIPSSQLLVNSNANSDVSQELYEENVNTDEQVLEIQFDQDVEEYDGCGAVTTDIHDRVDIPVASSHIQEDLIGNQDTAINGSFDFAMKGDQISIDDDAALNKSSNGVDYRAADDADQGAVRDVKDDAVDVSDTTYVYHDTSHNIAIPELESNHSQNYLESTTSTDPTVASRDERTVNSEQISIAQDQSSLTSVDQTTPNDFTDSVDIAQAISPTVTTHDDGTILLDAPDIPNKNNYEKPSDIPLDTAQIKVMEDVRCFSDMNDIKEDHSWNSIQISDEARYSASNASENSNETHYGAPGANAISDETQYDARNVNEISEETQYGAPDANATSVETQYDASNANENYDEEQYSASTVDGNAAAIQNVIECANESQKWKSNQHVFDDSQNMSFIGNKNSDDLLTIEDNMDNDRDCVLSHAENEKDAINSPPDAVDNCFYEQENSCNVTGTLHQQQGVLADCDPNVCDVIDNQDEQQTMSADNQNVCDVLYTPHEQQAMSADNHNIRDVMDTPHEQQTMLADNQNVRDVIDTPHEQQTMLADNQNVRDVIDTPHEQQTMLADNQNVCDVIDTPHEQQTMLADNQNVRDVIDTPHEQQTMLADNQNVCDVIDTPHERQTMSANNQDVSDLIDAPFEKQQVSADNFNGRDVINESCEQQRAVLDNDQIMREINDTPIEHRRISGDSQNGCATVNELSEQQTVSADNQNVYDVVDRLSGQQGLSADEQNAYDVMLVSPGQQGVSHDNQYGNESEDGAISSLCDSIDGAKVLQNNERTEDCYIDKQCSGVDGNNMGSIQKNLSSENVADIAKEDLVQDVQQPEQSDMSTHSSMSQSDENSVSDRPLQRQELDHSVAVRSSDDIDITLDEIITTGSDENGFTTQTRTEYV